jgi:hypothetical protein
LQDSAEHRRTAGNDVTADVHVEQGSIDLVVIGVAVGGLVVEHYDQVKVAVRTGTAFGSAAEEVDAQRVQSVHQTLDDGLESPLLRIETTVVRGWGPHEPSLAGTVEI